MTVQDQNTLKHFNEVINFALSWFDSGFPDIGSKAGIGLSPFCKKYPCVRSWIV